MGGIDPTPSVTADPVSRPPEERGRWLTPRRVEAAAWSLVVAQLLIRANVSGTGYLQGADFVLQSRAWQLPFPSVELLLTEHDGHLTPGGVAVGWAVAHTAPLSGAAVTASLILLQAVASGFVLLMLKRVFGSRPLVLLPLVVFLFSPLTLPASLWWTTALTTLPLQAGVAAAVWAHVGYLRSGSRWQLVIAIAGFAIALAFTEKALAIPLVLMGVTWTLSPRPGFIGSLARTVASHWRLWSLFAAVAAAYLFGFSRFIDRTYSIPGARELASWLRHGILEGILPAVVGGPLSWSPLGQGMAVADPPTWLVVLAVAAALVVVGWSCWARPRARRAWTMVGLLVVVDLAVTAGWLGDVEVIELVAASLRYTADGAVLVAFALGIAAMAPAGEPDPERVVASREWLGLRSGARWGSLVVADLFLLLAVASTVSLAGIWADNPARGWVMNAARTLQQAPGDVPILTAPVPEAVLSPIAYPANLTSHLLAPVSGTHVFGTRTASLSVFDGFGALVPGRVDGAGSVDSLEGGCFDSRAWRIDDGQGLVRLDEVLDPWEYTVHLAYLSGGWTAGTVTLGGGDPADIVVTRGVHDEYVQVTGGGSVLYLTLDDPDVVLCISTATVGQAVPESWPEP